MKRITNQFTSAIANVSGNYIDPRKKSKNAGRPVRVQVVSKSKGRTPKYKVPNTQKVSGVGWGY